MVRGGLIAGLSRFFLILLGCLRLFRVAGSRLFPTLLPGVIWRSPSLQDRCADLSCLFGAEPASCIVVAWAFGFTRASGLLIA
jgi:hypothetical protein